METQEFVGQTWSDLTTLQFEPIVCCLVLALVFVGFAQRAVGLEGMSYPVLEGVPLTIDELGSVNSGGFPTSNVTSPFNISLNFLNTPTTSEATAFAAAEATWESIIVGYQENVPSTTVTIDVNLAPIDGPGGILGSAGPSSGKGGTSTFLYANTGAMTFDSADTPSMSPPLLNAVILHEMGHVLGIGTMWSSSRIGVPGFQELYVTDSGQYAGAFGLAAYNAEFSQTGTFVPVELGGGPGTANGHWNEVNGGSGLTGIVNGGGQDFARELMTGWLNAPTFISSLTTESLRDLGYTVVPEPSAFVLMLLGAAGLLRCGRTTPFTDRIYA